MKVIWFSILFMSVTVFVVAFFPQISEIYSLFGITLNEVETAGLEQMSQTIRQFIPLFAVVMTLAILGEIVIHWDMIPSVGASESETKLESTYIPVAIPIEPEENTDDWECQYCKNMNPPERYECIKCGAGKKKVQMIR